MNWDQTEYIKDVKTAEDARVKMPSAMMGENGADFYITARVKMVLMFHRSTSITNTKVDTNEGIVTLSGNARNGAEKNLAAKLVTYIEGVKSVVNKMTIDEAIPISSGNHQML